MKVLAVDTSTRCGSVALLADRALIAEVRLLSAETHSARLLKSIQFLLDSSGWQVRDLQLVAAGIGPGSFTGIRIGVATAIGLAQTLGVPFAPVSGFDALAGRFIFLGEIGIVLDAQRRQVYFGEYHPSRSRPRCTVEPALWDPADLAERLGKRHLYLLGDGVSLIPDSDGGWPRRIDTDPFLAADIGRAALARKRSWRRGEFISAEPLYIRPPDALKSKLRKL